MLRHKFQSSNLARLKLRSLLDRLVVGQHSVDSNTTMVVNMDEENVEPCNPDPRMDGVLATSAADYH